jgi:replication factor C small subunit
MEDEFINSIWMEKYRPESIKGMVLPTKTMNYFKKIIDTGNIPNMIFHSVRPGPGKSSAAKAICNDLDTECNYINTSLHRGIDTLREDIQHYATTLSVTNIGKMKICVLDEFDGANDTFQKAMKASIEEFASTCRFIFTCNNLNKIIEPIRSRCELVDFNFTDNKIREEMVPKIYKRLCNILKQEKIEFNDATVKNIAMQYYPDIRHMIKLCQQYSTMYGVISDDIFKLKQTEEELITLIMSKKITASRKYIIDKGLDYDVMYRFIFDSIIPKIDVRENQAKAIIDMEEYMRGSVDSIDKEITFAACLFKLCQYF